MYSPFCFLGYEVLSISATCPKINPFVAFHPARLKQSNRENRMKSNIYFS